MSYALTTSRLGYGKRSELSWILSNVFVSIFSSISKSNPSQSVQTESELAHEGKAMRNKLFTDVITGVFSTAIHHASRLQSHFLTRAKANQYMEKT